MLLRLKISTGKNSYIKIQTAKMSIDKTQTQQNVDQNFCLHMYNSQTKYAFPKPKPNCMNEVTDDIQATPFFISLTINKISDRQYKSISLSQSNSISKVTDMQGKSTFPKATHNCIMRASNLFLN